MQYCGVTINVISYFILVISIGLLVDFLMHILLRYYESKGATRDAKVKATLETMGVSILMGAFTTLLGVIPLAFSTTKIFKMVSCWTDLLLPIPLAFDCFFTTSPFPSGRVAGLHLFPSHGGLGLCGWTGPPSGIAVAHRTSAGRRG
jgi:Patched family